MPDLEAIQQANQQEINTLQTEKGLLVEKIITLEQENQILKGKLVRLKSGIRDLNQISEDDGALRDFIDDITKDKDQPNIVIKNYRSPI